MKRTVAVALAVMTVLLAGCGNKTDTSSDAASSQKTVSSKVESKVESSIIPAVNDYKEHTYNLVEIMDYLKLDGRYYTAKTSITGLPQDCITYDHTAQMIAFNADCEGDVTLNIVTKCSAEQGRNMRYYTVFIDDVQQERVLVEGLPGTEWLATIPVAKGLERGKHSFRVYKETETWFGVDTLISVTMNGVPTERPKDSDLYIEFIGDSITAGYGNLTFNGDKDNPSFPNKSDGTQTYAFTAAQLLKADLSVIAKSGMSYSTEDTLTEVWAKTSWGRKNSSDYDFKRQADVVVINLGTNDQKSVSAGKLTDEQATQRAETFLQRVRECYPNAKIVWMYGMMGSSLNKQINQAVINMGGDQKGFYYLKGEWDNNGGGSHPCVDAHKRNGKLLADFIKGII